MKILWVAVLCCMMIGCAADGPPCPPGAGTPVTSEEADRRLEVAARAKAGKRDRDDDAVHFDCHDVVGTSQSATGYAPQSIWLTYGQVLTCLDILATRPSVPGQNLSLCLQMLARLTAADNVLRRIGVAANQELLNMYALSGVDCQEIERRVEVPQDELRRDGAKDLVPALLVVAARVAAGMAQGVMAPASFILMPRTQGEEACLDETIAPPAKRCSDASGCYEGEEGGPDPDVATPSPPTPLPRDPGSPDHT